MDQNNYTPGGMAPPPNMPPVPSQMPHQGYYGYAQPPAPDGSQSSGPYPSAPLSGLASGPYDPRSLQATPSYQNFSMPPPNFNPGFGPPPRFPPSGPPPFMPPNVPPAYHHPRYFGSQDYAPPSYDRGNQFTSGNDQAARIVQETEAKLQLLREKDSTENVQARDEAWLHNWLQKTGALYRLKTEQSTSCITIPDASSKLRRALHLLEKLHNEKEALKESSGDLTERQNDIQLMLDELAEIKNSLTGRTLDELVKKLDRAGKKRRRCRRQQREAMKQKMEKQEKLDALHKAIDEKMAAAAQKILDEKKAMEVKAAADSTLSEVRRKIQEASKAVDIISALTKLRSLRKDGAQRKGLYVSSEADESYKSKAEEMEKMLEPQLSVYDSEKKALEVMLEQEQEEDKEKEQEIKRIKEQQELKKLQRATETWLFGPKVNLHPEDPLYKYRQYYEVADRNINSLIQIRREWDAYLVPVNSMEGSAIPHGLVQPVAPSSAGWESVVVKPEPDTSATL